MAHGPLGVRLTTRTTGSRIHPIDSISQSTAIAILGSAVAYYIAVCLGPLFGSRLDHTSAFNLHHAVLLAILLRTPRTRWWTTLLALIPVYYFAVLPSELTDGALFWRMSYSFAAPLVTASLLRLTIGERDPFGDLRGVLIYGVIAGALVPAVMAFAAPGVIDAAAELGASVSIGSAWRYRYLIEAVSFIALTPAFLLWGRGGRWPTTDDVFRHVTVIALALGTYLALLLMQPGHLRTAAAPYVLVVLAVLVAFRFGVSGVASALCAVALTAAFWMANGRNPFSTFWYPGDVVSVQLLLFAVAWPAFATAALRRNLAARHAELEREHQEGTKAIERAARIVTAGEVSLAVVHEINQPLGAILNNAETGLYLLELSEAPREQLTEILRDIRKDNLRASDAIRSIRMLLKGHERECMSVDLNVLIAETVKLVQVRAKQQSVALETILEPIPLIFADPIQLQQALLNLLLNALDALKGASIDPHIWVRTVALGRGRVEVRVIDTGSGIPPEHLGKIFEPFYTSKRDGLGLGLSIVRTIVETHDGTITAENNRRSPGATFRFELPVVPRAVRARRQRAHLSEVLTDNG